MNCEVCNSPNGVKVSQKRGYNINKCTNCGHHFVFPLPTEEELNLIYSQTQGYFSTAISNLSSTSSVGAEKLHSLLKTYGVGKGTLLDVGCATGKLLFHLKRKGWSAHGVELNSESAQIGLNHGLDINIGQYDRNLYGDSTLDVINMGDFLEHVASPRDILIAANDHLRGGGVLIIAVPDAGSGFARLSLVMSRLSGFPWLHSEAPYHLHEFSESSLCSLLSQTGFKVLSISSKGGKSFSYIVGGAGYFDNLKKTMKAEGRYRLNLEFIYNIPKLFLISVAVAPVFLFGLILDRLQGRGSKLHVVAKKM